MRISDWSSDVCSSDLLIRRGRPAFLRASAARYPCGDDGGAPSLARYGISHPPRFIWRESSLVTVSIFGSAIKRYLQALLSGSARTLGERARTPRSEEHTSELQSLMRISYAVFCLKKKKITTK